MKKKICLFVVALSALFGVVLVSPRHAQANECFEFCWVLANTRPECGPVLYGVINPATGKFDGCTSLPQVAVSACEMYCAM